MNDKDFQSYDDSYKNLILTGLGESSALRARSFETLVIAERNSSLGVNPVTRMLKMLLGTKLALRQSLDHMAMLKEFLPINKHLSGWQTEIDEATTSTELGLICQRICSIGLIPRHHSLVS